MSIVSFGTRGGDFGDDDAAGRIFRARTCKHPEPQELNAFDEARYEWCGDCGSYRAWNGMEHGWSEWQRPKVSRYGK